jgi:hypothetical protein
MDIKPASFRFKRKEPRQWPRLITKEISNVAQAPANRVKEAFVGAANKRMRFARRIWTNVARHHVQSATTAQTLTKNGPHDKLPKATQNRLESYSASKNLDERVRPIYRTVSLGLVLSSLPNLHLSRFHPTRRRTIWRIVWSSQLKYDGGEGLRLQ